MQAVGLKTYIWNNNLKSGLLLAGFPVLLIGMVYALELLGMGWGVLPSTGRMSSDFGYAFRMLGAFAPLAIVVSLVWFAIAYFSYQAIIDLSTGARKVTRQEQPELYNLLENLAISRGMQTPAVRIIDDEAMNAFATGLKEGQYSVTVTTGLLSAMTHDELEAVLAHELTHVINRDVRLMIIASIFAGVITLLAQVIYRSLWFVGSGRSSRSDRRSGGGAFLFVIIALAIAAVGYALALVIKMAISRKREFLADAGSVELTKNPDAMISALLKIQGRSQLHAPESLRSMFLDDDEGPMSLFATHPPISKRVEALVRYAGGRLPQPEAVRLEAPLHALASVDADLSADEVHPAGPWSGRAAPETRPPGPWG